MKILIYFFSLTFIFFSCETSSEEDTTSNTETRIAKGAGIVYGGTLNLARNQKNASIFPAKVIDVSTTVIVNQIHNGLVRFDGEDLSVLPSIAKDWTIDDSQTVYTFKLRTNVFFHNDTCFEGGKGRLVVAEDFKYTFELLSQVEYSLNFNAIFRDQLKGASAYFDGKTDHISGVNVINDSTIELTLNAPKNSFIYGLAHVATSVIAKEAFDMYGENLTVGTGAFLSKNINKETNNILLTYNPNYYLKDVEGNKLPYLDSVNFRYVPTKTKELKLFRANELSVIHGLPSSKIAAVISDDIANFNQIPPKTILERKPEMGVDYYEFNLTRPPFNNKKVRQAFCYAVNKEKISTNIIKGQGTVARHGITPKISTFNGYDYDLLEGYSFNPQKARKLLAEAGYPEGKDFPYTRLEVNLNGNVHRLVASEFVSQIKEVLGINIEIDHVPFRDKIEHSKYAKAEIFRSGWVADFPSPESFLILCYGAHVPKSLEVPSHPNTMRYRNPVFDSLFRLGSIAKTKKESYDYFLQAEKIMIEDAPIMPFWYNQDYYLRQSYVRDFYNNPMGNYDLSVVYLKTLTKEEVIESRKKATHQEGL